MLSLILAGEVHPQPHISVFGNRKKMILIGGTHQFSLLRHRFGEHRFGNAASRGDFLLTVEHGSTVKRKSPREAAFCCFSKPVAQQWKWVGPTNENHFSFYYQTQRYVVVGEPHPQPHYQTASKFFPRKRFESGARATIFFVVA